jgi:hypothetical protein
VISILSNKLSIHITARRFYKHIRWINRSMHNFATGAILNKMSSILALEAIQATFFYESGLLVNKNTFVLLGNILKTLMFESEPLTLTHLVIGVFTPMTIYKCFCKTIYGISQFMILTIGSGSQEESFMHESTFKEHDIASKSSHEIDMLDFETLSILVISSNKS